MLTPADLIAFEQDIALTFNEGAIKAPIHLSAGNEIQLIEYFTNNFAKGDWIATAWRSHYHALLSGIPPEEVKQAILAGRSITLTFPDHNFISSAIVGGILPIAIGIALGLKRQNSKHRVHCFCGDMTARTGAYHEAYEYASGHALPITFITEDNGKSVGTPTKAVWGTQHAQRSAKEVCYTYNLGYPHAGSGVWIKF